MIELDIHKRWGSFSLDVQLRHQGGILGLLGASGCGKSKTLQCIAGIERPDAGKIVVGTRTFFDSERQVNVPVPQRRVGYLFQHYALFPNMTVEENIRCGVRTASPKGEARQQVRDMMERDWKGRNQLNYPAVSSSASPWPASWSMNRISCSWTNPSAPWTVI